MCPLRLFASVIQDWKNKHGSDVGARSAREAKRDCFLFWKTEIVFGGDEERIAGKTTLVFIFPVSTFLSLLLCFSSSFFSFQVFPPIAYISFSKAVGLVNKMGSHDASL
ncbi:hypothetical protein AAC387_Pa04g1007 [Persea americana]